jgi:hypothetical protein
MEYCRQLATNWPGIFGISASNWYNITNQSCLLLNRDEFPVKPPMFLNRSVGGNVQGSCTVLSDLKDGGGAQHRHRVFGDSVIDDPRPHQPRPDQTIRGMTAWRMMDSGGPSQMYGGQK